MLTPVTPPCYLTISQSENCAQADHRPASPLPHLAFKSALLKPFPGARGFLGHEPPGVLAWPCSKPFSAPNSDISVCLASLCVGHTNVH